jgi:lambda repressor-like predicted transcriptional regulator
VRKRDLTNAEIGAAFKAGGLALNSVNVPNTINSVLSRRFAKVGDIVKVSRGMWGLKEWHPHVRARKTNGDEDVELLEEMLAEEDEDE